ncbi:MAG: hypothetical protein LKM30_07480 [Bacilli bacterium]|jgi:hypothetical protein|nr:hypothetical protein [Bacilli bacterium]
MEEFVICIKAKPEKLSVDLLFQSLRDPHVIYHLRRDVLSKRIMNLFYIPDHPPILILKTDKEGNAKDIYWGYRDRYSMKMHNRTIFFHQAVLTLMGQIFFWIILPLIAAAIIVLIIYLTGYLDYIKSVIQPG